MKIRKIMVFAGVLAMGMLSACSGNVKKSEGAGLDKVQEAVSAQTLADVLVREGSFKDTMGAVDVTMALTRLYNLDESKITESAFFTNSNATAEEVAVIVVADDTYCSEVKASYEARIQDQTEACRDYLPDEIPKLEQAVIYENGNYVILCVSEDSDKVYEILEKYF
ncbi:MAG: DUF4358 domain-containing protein [Eubacteriales bacterium]|nr:DUF4358 domain-containing protein [Lachnospiraceae bacterium]MDO5127169.1 DUF4358 domain-containing protein [Eubacteriales bacterium]